MSPGRLVISGAAVATVDPDRTEYADGHLVADGNRIVAVGPGPASPAYGSTSDGSAVDGVRLVDGRGCLLTPGLVNTHTHLYQWATRGLAQQASLFDWLAALYPVWARLDEEIEHAAARGALAALALSGCTTSMDHHYVFPRGGGDLFGASVEAARGLGVRFHPTRGSMDLGQRDGGLPPDEIVEDTDRALLATAAEIAAHHDPTPGAMVRVGVAPCSPFSVTSRLMTEAAALARSAGVRLHTHLAETVEEDVFCRARYGGTPADYLDRLGWLGPDVWLAHCVHLDGPAIARFAGTGTGVAHCPSSNARLGAGIAPVAHLRTAGVPVGLGVDGAASNEFGRLAGELRQALLAARMRGGPAALSVRQALELGTVDGARCLGRADEIGSLTPGRLADLALWRVDGPEHADIDDPVAALILGPPAPLALLVVDGRVVVEDDQLRTGDVQEISMGVRRARRRLLDESGCG